MVEHHVRPNISDFHLLYFFPFHVWFCSQSFSWFLFWFILTMGGSSRCTWVRGGTALYFLFGSISYSHGAKRRGATRYLFLVFFYSYKINTVNEQDVWVIYIFTLLPWGSVFSFPGVNLIIYLVSLPNLQYALVTHNPPYVFFWGSNIVTHCIRS